MLATDVLLLWEMRGPGLAERFGRLSKWLWVADEMAEAPQSMYSSKVSLNTGRLKELPYCLRAWDKMVQKDSNCSVVMAGTRSPKTKQAVLFTECLEPPSN